MANGQRVDRRAGEHDALAASAEVAVAEIERLQALGMGPIERVQAARIRAAAGRLRECTAELAKGELLVSGSMGQRRPHPLLKVEQELRREIDEGIRQLAFRAEQRAMLARIKTRHERRATATEGDSA
ncbi:MAG TPA: hypothetical protein VK538_01795 [Solirubrobacteraceae bacterium]|nr:hypothetical protein [Solirubrobacteraceae bacterium]